MIKLMLDGWDQPISFIDIYAFRSDMKFIVPEYEDKIDEIADAITAGKDTRALEREVGIEFTTITASALVRR